MKDGKRWKLYNYVSGFKLTEQPSCILDVDDKVMVKTLEGTYEIFRTYDHKVTIVNPNTNVHLTIDISDIEMVYY